MKQSAEIELAKKIIQLDLLRDELFEELIILLGPKAYELLRSVQNNELMEGRT